MDPLDPTRAPFAQARMPAGALYTHPRLVDRVLARSWHLVATLGELALDTLHPVTLLPGVLDEPLLLRRVEGGVRALSNACTHRGALLLTEPSRASRVRCPYHGRIFDRQGRCHRAPGMEGVPGFPEAHDHLPEIPCGVWGPFVFVSLAPAQPFEDWIHPWASRAPLTALTREPAEDRLYRPGAPWPLWCENYLEGLHVPYVHPGLSGALDLQNYQTRSLETATVQLGGAPDGDPTLDLPPEHPEHGMRLAGLYVFLFPGVAFNLYPWGVSLNIVRPTGPDSTEVLYQRWVSDPAALGQGAGGDLDTVEREDDAIIERVWRGVRARAWRGGRYVPGWEEGGYAFHRWLDGMMGKEEHAVLLPER